MKSLHILLAFPLLLVSRGATRAQDAILVGTTAPAPPEHRAAPIRTVSQALDFWRTIAEREVIAAGDAMPEDRYSLAPAAGGFTGVRRFGHQLKQLRVGQGPAPSSDESNRVCPGNPLSGRGHAAGGQR